MRRPRRRSPLHAPFGLLLRLLFNIAALLVRLLIPATRLIPGSLLLLIGATGLGYLFLQRYETGGLSKWVILAAAIALAFAAGTLRNRR